MSSRTALDVEQMNEIWELKKAQARRTGRSVHTPCTMRRTETHAYKTLGGLSVPHTKGCRDGNSVHGLSLHAGARQAQHELLGPKPDGRSLNERNYSFLTQVRTSNLSLERIVDTCRDMESIQTLSGHLLAQECELGYDVPR